MGGCADLKQKRPWWDLKGKWSNIYLLARYCWISESSFHSHQGDFWQKRKSTENGGRLQGLSVTWECYLCVCVGSVQREISWPIIMPMWCTVSISDVSWAWSENLKVECTQSNILTLRDTFSYCVVKSNMWIYISKTDKRFLIIWANLAFYIVT